MANIQFIFFDLGGVVINFRQGFAAFSSRLGFPQPLIERAYVKHLGPAAHGLMSAEEFWTRFRAELNLSQDGAIADYQEFWTESFAPILETHALLRELAPAYRLGIISNTEPGIFEQVSRKGHVPNLPFEAVILSCEVGCVKPDKQIYQIAQDRADVRPAEILFIDDRAENVRGAEALGWHGVLFDDAHPGKSIEDIRAKLS